VSLIVFLYIKINIEMCRKCCGLHCIYPTTAEDRTINSM